MEQFRTKKMPPFHDHLNPPKLVGQLFELVSPNVSRIESCPGNSKPFDLQKPGAQATVGGAYLTQTGMCNRKSHLCA
jgi:hypothetical protein